MHARAASHPAGIALRGTKRVRDLHPFLPPNRPTSTTG